MRLKVITGGRGEALVPQPVSEIRRDPLLEDFPVLVSVDEKDSFAEDKLLDLGVIDFLKKPFVVRNIKDESIEMLVTPLRS